MGDFTKAEKLLVAAGHLAEQGRPDFTAEDLVVSAHKAFPSDFAMKGYPDFPDSNSILTQVMGKKAPLIVRGWLDKTGAKKYRLTPKGLDDLNALEGGGGISAAKVNRLREEDFGNLLSCAAFEMAREGRADEITFYQFCRFVGLHASDKWQVVRGKLTHTEHLADELLRMGGAGQPLRIFARGKNMDFAPDDLRLVRPLLDQLLGKFKQQMSEWQRNAHA